MCWEQYSKGGTKLGELVTKNLVIEFSSSGGADGAAYLENYRFSFSPESNIVTQQNAPISSDFVGGRTLGLSSVLVAVPAIISTGLSFNSLSFSGSGVASGTTLTARFIVPGTGSVATEILVKV